MARGRGRVFAKSFGCPSNVADGEVMMGCLSGAGYDIVNRAEEADFLVYNTCAVKTPTENRMLEVLKRAPKGKKLIVTGCLPLINFERLSAEVRFDGALGPAPGDNVVEVLRQVEEGRRVVALERNAKPSLKLPKVRVNEAVGIIPVNYGCLGSCSYCCVLFARGRLRSYSIEEVMERVKCDLASGVEEVWLTSQDTACYGRDLGVDLVGLLEEICSIHGSFFIRVGMMTPNQALIILDDLIKAYRDEKVFKFLHLPVQSGDDETLRRMNRFYSIEEFKKVVYAFRSEIPETTLATDVICGFPGESGEAFEQTARLVQEICPDIVNVSKFFPRPGTPAAEMELRVPQKETKERSRRMADLTREVSFERNKTWVGWRGRILIDEKGKSPDSWIGRNFAYKPIVVKSDEFLLGRFMEVCVTKGFPTHLEAEFLDASEPHIQKLQQHKTLSFLSHSPK